MNNYICALSGESPISDPVCTPTGQICSKRLLLQKLTETNGTNPFITPSKDDNSPPPTLDESQLIHLTTTKDGTSSKNGSTTKPVLVPPKLPSCTSIPSLLTTLQNEYDTLVLELYDTRRALHETRQELTESLYQNDAAIRVVARLALERDVARKEVQNVLANRPTTTTTTDEAGGGGGGEEDGGSAKKRKLNPSEGADAPSQDEEMKDAELSADAQDDDGHKIPSKHVEQMEETWKRLSTERKNRKKLKKKQSQAADYQDPYATPDQLRQWSCLRKKKLHKASYKAGLFALSGTVDKDADDNNNNSPMMVTNARDKQLIFYDGDDDVILHKDSIKTTLTTSNCLDCCYSSTAKEEKIVACVGEDGILRVYSLAKKEGEGEKENVVDSATIAILNADLKKEEGQETDKEDNVVGLCIHPTGRHIFVLTSLGNIHVVLLTSNDDTTEDEENDKIKLEVVAVLKDDANSSLDYQCTSLNLHPDGLILAVGRNDGKFTLWDLKTQKIAATLENSDINSSITSISFSENGYHVATSTHTGIVTIWDLRKQKILGSTVVQEDGEGKDGKEEKGVVSIPCVVFCPEGKFVAYGTSNGKVVIRTVKGLSSKDGEEKEDEIVLKSEVKKNTTSPKRKKKGSAAAVAAPAPQNVCGLVWGSNAKSLAYVSDAETSVNFWGLEESSS